MERRGRAMTLPSIWPMENQMEAGLVSTPAELDEQLLSELHEAPTLGQLSAEDLPLLRGTERLFMPSGSVWTFPGSGSYTFCVLLQGEISVSKLEGKRPTHIAGYKSRETFGETPMLLGPRSFSVQVVAVEDCRILRIPEDSFWKLLANSPQVRASILADHSRRYETYQAMALHREKLVSLGTLAAGLMHELNNPGSAARRAASQLRENMSRLQQISLRLTRTEFTPEQTECLAALQEQILQLERPANYSALDQADREEALSDWLETMGVEDPWHLAPTMVSAGWSRDHVACAGSLFPPRTFSDALNYLGALMSSMGHVATIEESIARVTDLVTAVKKYAYDDKNKLQQVDVRDSLLSTLTILSHKFRQKGIQVDRSLPPAETKISCVGAGLAQVWTNLLDNAIDAAPENGKIAVRLWTEGDAVLVGIRDNGHGIPQEHQEHIFEPFYTTKEAGVGTGLGLDIAHRIVVGNFHGSIEFTSAEDGTEFVVRLPIEEKAAAETESCSVAIG